MTIDELRDKADESIKKIKEEGDELIGRLRRINEHLDAQNKMLDEAKWKMNIIDHGWKKIEKPEWLEEWSTLMDYETIKKAIKENKVYDIDRLFWNGGKLFGYDTYYEILLGCLGDCDEKIGPFIKVMRNGEEYEILLKFDWEKCFLSLTCKSFNPYIFEPVGAEATVLFDTLFGVKDSVVKTLIDTEIEILLTNIEQLRNDGKKDNRNS